MPTDRPAMSNLGNQSGPVRSIRLGVDGRSLDPLRNEPAVADRDATHLSFNIVYANEVEAPWPTSFVERFPNVRAVWLIFDNGYNTTAAYLQYLMQSPALGHILDSFAALPRLTNLAVSLTGADRTGDYYIEIVNRVRPTIFELGESPGGDIFSNIIENVQVRGMRLAVRRDDLTASEVIAALIRRRFESLDLEFARFDRQVLALVHPELREFALTVVGGMITRHGNNFDALAKRLRAAPGLRELRLAFPTADSRTIDCAEMALTVAGMQLDVAHFRPTGGVHWHANSILLLNAALRSERIVSCQTFGMPPAELMGGRYPEWDYASDLKRARDLYPIVAASGSLPPEMMLQVVRSMAGVKEALLAMLSLPITDVVQAARVREARRGDLFLYVPSKYED